MANYNSFADLGKAKGIKSKDKEIRPLKCRNCGGQMLYLKDSNIHVCPSCGNYFLAKKRS